MVIATGQLHPTGPEFKFYLDFFLNIFYALRCSLSSPTEAYSKPCQTSKIELLANAANGYLTAARAVKPFAIFAISTRHLKCLTGFQTRLSPEMFF